MLNRVFRGTLLKLAPKKKGGAAAETKAAPIFSPEENQVFNIFQDVEDPPLLADENYPSWLWSLNQPAPTYAELNLMFVHGHQIEKATAYHYHRFLRLHRKLLIKLNNERLRKSGAPRTFV